MVILLPYYHASDQILRSFSIYYFRMCPRSFDELLNFIKDQITHEDTNMRKAISAEEMLAFTLRYLASGCSLKDIHYNYRMGRSTVAKLIRIVCITIWNILRKECMPELHESMWLNIAEGFRNQANFPNCIGAVDGKHIRVVKPVGSGSSYMNYKHFFSIILLGIADSNYNFVYVDIGSFGKDSDATIFQNSSFWKKLENKCLNIPKPTLVPGIEHPLPFAFVRDEAFGLSRKRDGYRFEDTLTVVGLEDAGNGDNININRSLNRYRDALANYFVSSSGEVPWQYDRL
nr:unnamed protein product [Callosobruchus chinensis]